MDPSVINLRITDGLVQPLGEGMKKLEPIPTSEHLIKSIPTLYPNLKALQFRILRLIVDSETIVSSIKGLHDLRSLTIGFAVPKTRELIQVIAEKTSLKNLSVQHRDTDGLKMILQEISLSRSIEILSIINPNDLLVGEYLVPLYKMKSLKNLAFDSMKKSSQVDSRWWAPLPVENLTLVGNILINLEWNDFRTNTSILSFCTKRFSLGSGYESKYLDHPILARNRRIRILEYSCHFN